MSLQTIREQIKEIDKALEEWESRDTIGRWCAIMSIDGIKYKGVDILKKLKADRSKLSRMENDLWIRKQQLNVSQN